MTQTADEFEEELIELETQWFHEVASLTPAQAAVPPTFPRAGIGDLMGSGLTAAKSASDIHQQYSHLTRGLLEHGEAVGDDGDDVNSTSISASGIGLLHEILNDQIGSRQVLARKVPKYVKNFSASKSLHTLSSLDGGVV